MLTPEVATAGTFDALVQSDSLVVAWFWGPACANCEAFARDLPSLQDDLPAGVRLVKVNAFEHPELARRFALIGVPSFVLFKGGRKLGMMQQYDGRAVWTRVVKAQLAATS